MCVAALHCTNVQLYAADATFTAVQFCYIMHLISNLMFFLLYISQRRHKLSDTLQLFPTPHGKQVNVLFQRVECLLLNRPRKKTLKGIKNLLKL